MRCVLNLSNGCGLVFHIDASSNVPDATYGTVVARAGIVRPTGHGDPDATSADRAKTSPGSAAEECRGNCNNIRTNGDVFLLDGRPGQPPIKNEIGRDGNWPESARAAIEQSGFFLPNVVTPNGDGKNDTFEIIGPRRFDRMELEISDRSGRTVFRSSDYRNIWRIPESLPEGTYLYTFKGLTGNERPIVRNGTVLILRGLLY